ncbi:hypothetical protein V1511DRAFT_491848 [Dipodascopsis uninucleata]
MNNGRKCSKTFVIYQLHLTYIFRLPDVNFCLQKQLIKHTDTASQRLGLGLVSFWFSFRRLYLLLLCWWCFLILFILFLIVLIVSSFLFNLLGSIFLCSWLLCISLCFSLIGILSLLILVFLFILFFLKVFFFFLFFLIIRPRLWIGVYVFFFFFLLVRRQSLQLLIWITSSSRHVCLFYGLFIIKNASDLVGPPVTIHSSNFSGIVKIGLFPQ